MSATEQSPENTDPQILPGFWVGKERIGEFEDIELTAKSLLRHVMALGSSGSGKTVFCKVLTEEVLLHGVPAICIDRQGDLCSLVLNAGDDQWLVDHGLSPELAALFAERIDPVIFTPSSRKGIALSSDPLHADLDELHSREQIRADVDYKAMSQFGTWAIGRLTTRQDIKKVQPTIKSLNPVHVDQILQELPSQKPDELMLTAIAVRAFSVIPG